MNRSIINVIRRFASTTHGLGPTPRIVVFSNTEHKRQKIVQTETQPGKTVTVPPPRWSEDAASTSESVVKADRKKKDYSMEQLQHKTIVKLRREETREKGKSVHEIDE